MKKLAIVALAAATLGTGLTSCDNAGSTSGKASSDVDSLSMALGVLLVITSKCIWINFLVDLAKKIQSLLALQPV